MISSQDLEITDLFEDENVDNAAGTAQQNKGNKKKWNPNDEISTDKIVKKIRIPQPKLNPQRLCGDRGIVQLPKIFSEVKLKGKGHEKEDLDRVMKTLEHWSHRLFPKFTFDDVLERIEKLGSKRTVQNCVNRIRMDLPVLSEDYVSNNNDDIVDSKDENPSPVIDEQLNASIFGTLSTSQENRNIDAAAGLEVSQVTKPLTADQLTKIEQNRLTALERRTARFREAAQSAATLNAGMTTIAENTSNLSTNGTTPDPPSLNQKDNIEQTTDNDAMLTDENLSVLDDSNAITTTNENVPPGVGSTSTVFELITKDKSTDGSDNMKTKTNDIVNADAKCEVIETTLKLMYGKEKSLTSANSSRSNSPIDSDLPDGGHVLIKDNEVCQENVIIEAKSQDRVEGIGNYNISNQIEAHEPMEIDNGDIIDVGLDS